MTGFLLPSLHSDFTTGTFHSWRMLGRLSGFSAVVVPLQISWSTFNDSVPSWSSGWCKSVRQMSVSEPARESAMIPFFDFYDHFPALRAGICNNGPIPPGIGVRRKHSCPIWKIRLDLTLMARWDYEDDCSRILSDSSQSALRLCGISILFEFQSF